MLTRNEATPCRTCETREREAFDDMSNTSAAENRGRRGSKRRAVQSRQPRYNDDYVYDYDEEDGEYGSRGAIVEEEEYGAALVDPPPNLSKDELKVWKREQRKIRNRQSAALSRKRKSDRIDELEGMVERLMRENADLQARLDRAEDYRYQHEQQEQQKPQPPSPRQVQQYDQCISNQLPAAYAH